MSTKQIVALLHSHIDRDDEQFLSLALQFAADEARAGRSEEAQRLKQLVQKARDQNRQGAAPVRSPIPMARPKGELQDLVESAYPKTGFRARVNAAQENDGERAEPEASHWLLGSKSGAAGSLHCDLWRGRAIELAGHDAIAIYPVGGWWKSHAGQRRGDERARYSLLISLSAPGHTVDMHSEVAARVEVRAAEIAQAIEAS